MMPSHCGTPEEKGQTCDIRGIQKQTFGECISWKSSGNHELKGQSIKGHDLLFNVVDFPVGSLSVGKILTRGMESGDIPDSLWPRTQ